MPDSEGEGAPSKGAIVSNAAMRCNCSIAAIAATRYIYDKALQKRLRDTDTGIMAFYGLSKARCAERIQRSRSSSPRLILMAKFAASSRTSDTKRSSFRTGHSTHLGKNLPLSKRVTWATSFRLSGWTCVQCGLREPREDQVAQQLAKRRTAAYGKLHLNLISPKDAGTASNRC
jgi:hypothetical protein